MKHIRQKHVLGCVVASIAMIANCSYDDALKLVHPNRKKWQPTHTNIYQIGPALDKLKIKIKMHLGTVDLLSIKNPSLVCYPQSKQLGHCVVFDPKRNKILDPLKIKSLPIIFYKNKIKNGFIIELYDKKNSSYKQK